MHFTATVEPSGRSATGIPVPEEVVTALGGGRRPAVAVTIGPHRFQLTLGSMGGRVMIPLSAENRSAAGVAAGDEVTVQLELDAAPREVQVPEALAAALTADPEADRFFRTVSPSQRRWFADQVTGAKTEATRDRRIEKLVAQLREGRAR
ncbi:YdeI/OmpD-associated family protein [Nakamurella endophytica]|uniref:DUF1905 domain-containing protein n=1 Tax=Nakamurella endophytica TaxID=1748367 RepID=A0A917WDN9_9ACTN|nr:YdeI/OmpD-associated family protein [Nakamurella endophytica]GGL93400.1 hypothetical protein GCM10011594_11560 [Nakamurella endophytica]